MAVSNKDFLVLPSGSVGLVIPTGGLSDATMIELPLIRVAYTYIASLESAFGCG